MAAQNSPGAAPAQRAMVITRTFDAPRELVFQLWTDPEHVARWWGPHYFTNPRCEWDARPGGAILIHMRGPDGTIYPDKGVFREVVPPERLVFTSTALEDEAGVPQLETLITVTFDDLAGRTRLTLRAEVVKALPAAEGALSGMEMGWNQSLDRFADILRAVSGDTGAAGEEAYYTEPPRIK